MSRWSYSWVIPIASMLCAITLGWAAGPSLTAMMRAQAAPTGTPCKVTAVTILPIMSTVHVTDFIKNITAPPDQVLTNANKVVELDSGDFEVFGTNTNTAGMHRVVAGKGRPGDLDDSNHDVVLVKIDGVSKPNTLESILVESVDVDDPSAFDPGKNDVTAIEGKALNNLAGGNAKKFYLKGNKGQVSIGGLDSAAPAPAIDWENLNSDNRGDKNTGGAWLKYGQLSKSEKAALEDTFHASQGGRPTLKKANIDIPQPLNCTKNFTSFSKDVGKGKGVECERIKVDKIKVNDAGQFTVWLLFQTSMQPGDNFRIMAICESNKGKQALESTIPLQSDPTNLARLRVKLRNKNPLPPLPDPNTGRQFRGDLRDEDIIHDDPVALFPGLVISNLLTVWRRLHLEVDFMAGTPPGTQLPADHQAVNLIAPDHSLFKSRYKPAYVEVEADLTREANTYTVYDFLHHTADSVMTDKNWFLYVTGDAFQRPGGANPVNTLVFRKPDFWINYIAAMYQSIPGLGSNEPLGNDLTDVFGGISGQFGDAGGSNVLISAAFHETCRRTSTVGDIVLAGAGGRADAAFQNIVQRVYIHESGHQFTDSKSHLDGQLMFPLNVWDGRPNNATVFANRTLATIRSNESP